MDTTHDTRREEVPGGEGPAAGRVYGELRTRFVERVCSRRRRRQMRRAEASSLSATGWRSERLRAMEADVHDVAEARSKISDEP